MKETKKPFDPAKPVQTRDGKPARIHATDMYGTCPILASYKVSDGWVETRLNKDGRFWKETEHPLDLLNVPPPKVKRDFWLNIHKTGISSTFTSEEEATSVVKFSSWPDNWRTVKVTAEYEPFEDE